MARSSLVALVVACLLACSLASDDDEKYADKYDHVDVDAILANDRIRKQYVNCFLDAGPCITPDATFLKAHFPEAIVTKCRKCTERQKMAFEKVAVWFNDNDPEGWNEVIRKGVSEFQRKGAMKKAAEAKAAEAKAAEAKAAA